MVIHADKIRWLFWARWRMLFRGFRRSRSSLIGSIISLVVVLFFAGWGAFGTFSAYRFLPAPANGEVLYIVVTGLFLLWMTLPLMEFTGNESMDVSKLSLFPLTRGELMVSLLFSSLLDIPTVGLLLLFIAIVAGWAVSLPVALMAVVTLLVLYVMLIGISQLVLALFTRVLQSRRFRDFSIILIAVVFSSCYLASQLIFGGTRALEFYQNLLNGSFSPFLQWLPPGFAASAIKQAALGNWANSFASLLALLAWSLVLLFLWQVVLQRSLTAAETGGTARVRQRQQAALRPARAAVEMPAERATGWVGRLLPEQIRAMAWKDLVYYWRDPQLKALFFQSIVYIAVFVVLPIINGGSGRTAVFGKSYSLYASPLVVLLFVASISLNVLGLERQGLTTTFLFPIDPKRLLWGKNLAVSAIAVCELIVLVLLSAFLSQNWPLALVSFVLGLSGIGVMLGCGNFTSVYFPQYMRTMQRGMRVTGTTSQSGCLRAIMSLVMLVVAAVLVVPVGLGLYLPLFLNAEPIWAITMPLSLAYGIAIHQVVTRRVAPRILDQTPEILAITTRE
jgi:ABC-2 type transport system permease protein